MSPRWPPKMIAALCETEYARYERDLEARYSAYFAVREAPEIRRHKWSASSIETALPEGWADRLRPHIVGREHSSYLSGKSSQLLTLGLLGPALELSED